MKNIKTFELFYFGYDDNAIKTYVDYLLSSEDFVEVFNTIGLDAPTELSGDDYDDKMQEARELAIVYFTNHPVEVDIEKMNQALSIK